MGITGKIAVAALAACLWAGQAPACTSAIVSGRKTAGGRPLLWKHRDTGEENNKVERVAARDGAMEYVALFNASDSLCLEAWAGYNSAGFAVINTASYNLNDSAAAQMDREGLIMTRALRICRCVDDFEALLDTLPKPLGVEANFGVIDAGGGGAYFETGNYSWTRFDLADSPDGVLVRTNYSHSGREGEGMGYVRELNALHLFAPHVLEGDFTPATLTEEVSRSFYHCLMGRDMAGSGVEWLVDQDFIPRRSSSATVVIEGVAQGESGLLTVMWIGIGYPPCSEIRAAWLGEDGVPRELCGEGEGGRSPLCDTVVARKHEVFPIKRGNGEKYIRLDALYNGEGTGYCQRLAPDNMLRYEQGYVERRRRAEAMEEDR